MLDSDLAALYGVETKAFNRAIKRNLDRFPSDFMFQLTGEEFDNLRYQFGTSRWGGRRYRPYAFTEHERKLITHDRQIVRIVEVIRQLTPSQPLKKKRAYGFVDEPEKGDANGG